MNTSGAYSKYDLKVNIKLIKLMFHIFNGDEEQKAFNYGEKLDALSFIDAYMHSEVRKKMDEGDYITHYYGDKQVYNRIDKSACLPRTVQYDLDALHWMAEIYCVLQWKYFLYSSDISDILPAKELYGMYDQLKDLPIGKACDKIYDELFMDKELPNTPPYVPDEEEEEYAQDLQL